MQATCIHVQYRGVLARARVLHYILATRVHVCKFLHMCVASYMLVHTSKISMHVFVSAMCVSHMCPMCVDFVLHVCISETLLNHGYVATQITEYIHSMDLYSLT